MVFKSLFYRTFRIHAIYNLYGKFLFTLYKKNTAHQGVQDDSGEILIITIAFNNAELIRQQIESVKKFVTDNNYKHIIVDNSSDERKRTQIRTICQADNVDYKEVPYSPYLKFCQWIGLYSMSHGIAINWTYYNIIFPRNPKYFVLLDHDVFPVKKYNFAKAIDDADFYGVRRIREGGWYIWPGWGVYRNQALSSNKPNFLPYFNKHVFFDTGGSNYKRLYLHYNLQELRFPLDKLHRVKNSEELTSDDDIYHSDYIQSIDESWIHLINGSNYYQLKGKEQTINNILEDISFFEEFKY